MLRVMVFITLSNSGIETIKSNPELPKEEMEFVNLETGKHTGKLFYFRFQKRRRFSISNY